MSHAPILPGATLGVLGSGQLGRMFAIAARRMGYRVHTFSPEDDTPTGQIADVEVTASYEDLDALRAFARQVQVATFEFENVPIESQALKGQDSLYSIVQMPPGIPVGTLAIGKAGAINAALLAASVLALSDKTLAKRLAGWREKQTKSVAERPKDEA